MRVSLRRKPFRSIFYMILNYLPMGHRPFFFGAPKLNEIYMSIQMNFYMVDANNLTQCIARNSDVILDFNLWRITQKMCTIKSARRS